MGNSKRKGATRLGDSGVFKFLDLLGGTNWLPLGFDDTGIPLDFV